MRRSLFVLLVLLAPLSSAFAAGWKKAYFGATPPGSWARYSDKSPEMFMTTTTTRLPDASDGSARVEVNVQFANKQYPPVRNRYTLKHGFALNRQLIDYLTNVTAASVVSGDGEPAELDAATIDAIVKNSPAYEPAVTFKGPEYAGGQQTDRYGYTLHNAGDPPTVETGDLWLSEGVPFGIVKQTSVTKDANGHTTTSYERVLLESGTSTVPAETVPSPQKTSYTLEEAYDAGLVAVRVTIPDGVKNGERAHLVLAAKDDARLTLVVPKGKTKLHVDVPLDDFVFELAAAKTFVLGSGHTAELDVKQVGDPRALAGKFQISTHEGTPLYSGSATVGPVEK